MADRRATRRAPAPVTRFVAVPSHVAAAARRRRAAHAVGAAVVATSAKDGRQYEAKIVAVERLPNPSNGDRTNGGGDANDAGAVARVKVHFRGFSKKNDEWLAPESVAPATAATAKKANRGTLAEPLPSDLTFRTTGEQERHMATAHREKNAPAAKRFYEENVRRAAAVPPRRPVIFNPKREPVVFRRDRGGAWELVCPDGHAEPRAAPGGAAGGGGAQHGREYRLPLNWKSYVEGSVLLSHLPRKSAKVEVRFDASVHLAFGTIPGYATLVINGKAFRLVTDDELYDGI